MPVKQLPFDWHHPHPEVQPTTVVLDPNTIARVIARMATALIMVVRGAAVAGGVADDER
jgi:hypothetical protein